MALPQEQIYTICGWLICGEWKLADVDEECNEMMDRLVEQSSPIALKMLIEVF